MGTERHESRRIDNQLRGRSGRQGDPGASVFYISLKDELMRIFGGDQIDGMLKKLGLKKMSSLTINGSTRQLKELKKKLKEEILTVRKTLIKFDDVMNDQRQVIFSQRLNILKSQDISNIISTFLTNLEKLNEIKNIYDKNNDQNCFQQA